MCILEDDRLTVSDLLSLLSSQLVSSIDALRFEVAMLNRKKERKNSVINMLHTATYCYAMLPMRSDDTR